jgi:hypothetical protein
MSKELGRLLNQGIPYRFDFLPVILLFTRDSKQLDIYLSDLSFHPPVAFDLKWAISFLYIGLEVAQPN